MRLVRQLPARAAAQYLKSNRAETRVTAAVSVSSRLAGYGAVGRMSTASAIGAQAAPAVSTPAADVSGARPAHHSADGKFVNPWTSYEDHGPLDFFMKALPEWKRVKYYALPTVPVDFAAIANPASALQTTWLGHVTFLMQTQGYHILTDPVFSKYASPVQFAGPERYTPAPCKIDDLPPIHCVLISHNHYDHLDYNSIKQLLAKEQRELGAASSAKTAAGAGQQREWQHAPYTGTTFIVPLKVSQYLISMGVPKEKIIELDWWQSVTLPTKPTSSAASAGGSPFASARPPVITAVPAQHQSARTIWDRNASLWCGYVCESPSSAPAAEQGSKSVKWYFSGDTGYRSVPKGTQPYSDAEMNAVRCPAFKEIGEKFGGFDLALLPVGAYRLVPVVRGVHASSFRIFDRLHMHRLSGSRLRARPQRTLNRIPPPNQSTPLCTYCTANPTRSPRGFMSSFHASPEDAVEMHVDVKSKR